MRSRLAVTLLLYRGVAYATLAALTLIVMSGAAVRLRGSGLGCPNWPKCGGSVLPPPSSHPLIEFGNGVIAGVVRLMTTVAVVLAYTRRAFRRELFWLALTLPPGALAEAVLGGLTVEQHLARGFVMGPLQAVDDRADRGGGAGVAQHT